MKKLTLKANSLRDAPVTAITLNPFNQNCDRVEMANIAQRIQLRHSMILADSEKTIATPTYLVTGSSIAAHNTFDNSAPKLWWRSN